MTILNVFLSIKKANIHKLQNFIITNKFLVLHHKPDERRGVELRASEIQVQVAGNAGREGVVGKINTRGIEKESAHEVLSLLRIFSFIQWREGESRRRTSGLQVEPGWASSMEVD